MNQIPTSGTAYMADFVSAICIAAILGCSRVAYLAGLLRATSCTFTAVLHSITYRQQYYIKSHPGSNMPALPSQSLPQGLTGPSSVFCACRAVAITLQQPAVCGGLRAESGSEAGPCAIPALLHT